jgi:hypothetical protein
MPVVKVVAGCGRFRSVLASPAGHGNTGGSVTAA